MVQNNYIILTHLMAVEMILGERVDTVNLAIPDDAEIVQEDCEACTI